MNLQLLSVLQTVIYKYYLIAEGSSQLLAAGDCEREGRAIYGCGETSEIAPRSFFSDALQSFFQALNVFFEGTLLRHIILAGRTPSLGFCRTFPSPLQLDE